MVASRFYRTLAVTSVLALITWGCSAETLNQRTLWEDDGEHHDEDGHDHENEHENNGGTGDALPNSGSSATVDYTRDIAPIMTASCAGCHGSSGGIDVSSKDKLQQNIDASISAIERGTMPKGDKPKVTAAQVTLLKNWKAAGFPDSASGSGTGTNTGGSTPTPSQTTVGYAKDIAPIMTASCAGCHGSSGGVDVSTKEKLQQNFDASLKAIENGSMPKGNKPKVTAAQITLLKNWKAAGFPN